jgi:hypothetical protein
MFTRNKHLFLNYSNLLSRSVNSLETYHDFTAQSYNVVLVYSWKSVWIKSSVILQMNFSWSLRIPRLYSEISAFLLLDFCTSPENFLTAWWECWCLVFEDAENWYLHLMYEITCTNSWFFPNAPGTVNSPVRNDYLICWLYVIKVCTECQVVAERMWITIFCHMSIVEQQPVVFPCM